LDHVSLRFDASGWRIHAGMADHHRLGNHHQKDDSKAELHNNVSTMTTTAFLEIL
jgi:hypothetical protein